MTFTLLKGDDMNDKDTVRSLVESLVIPDRKAERNAVDQEATAKTLTAILEGGPKSITALIDLLTEPGKDDDSKARYALHALAVQAGGRKDARRRGFAATLAEALGGDRPRAVKAFVVRQLQVVGESSVNPALGRLLLDDELCGDAAQALLAIKDGAAAEFRGALRRAAGKPRLTAVHALGTLRDAEAAEALRELAGEKDRDLRLTALWALANIGDAGSVSLFLQAKGAEGYERVKVTSACLLLAERLLAAGRKVEAVKLYSHLRDTHTDPGERHIREAAERGLEAAR
jgi:HEAT repeat protein